MNSSEQYGKSNNSQWGFTLIEVMVAMLIVSVGILGVAGIQLVSLQQNQSAMLNSEALMVGNTILDRIRANAQSDYGGVDYTDVPTAAARNCITSSCSPAEMAVYDIAQWKCSINSTLEPVANTSHPVCLSLATEGKLPDGNGRIVKAIDSYTVTIEWRDDRAGARREISLRTQIRGT